MASDKRKYNILVIEDNPGDFALVEDFLFEQIEAPIISHAKNYKEARGFLCVDSQKFDIVLLDLSLPDKTGEALILDIVEICYHTPIIVLTGYADFDFGIKSLSLGISDYILKDEITAIALHRSIVYNAERKKIAAALAESEKNYSELFHLSPLPMWVVDLDTLVFLDVNKATIDHYGYTRDEFLSMTLADIRIDTEIKELENGIAEDRLNITGHTHRITTHKLKNGDLRSVELQIAPIMYQEKKANIVVATDITERLRYITAIEEQNQRFRDISWLQSHIIRAPLARIMGLIPLITNKDFDTEERDQMLEFLALSANELDTVIKNITDKTKPIDYAGQG